MPEPEDQPDDAMLPEEATDVKPRSRGTIATGLLIILLTNIAVCMSIIAMLYYLAPEHIHADIILALYAPPVLQVFYVPFLLIYLLIKNKGRTLYGVAIGTTIAVSPIVVFLFLVLFLDW